MALISKVSIGNLALSALGTRSRIDAFTEDSKEAEQVSLWYDISRQQALEDYPWYFSTKRKALAVHGEAAPTGLWQFRYQYPADCLRAQLIENPLGPQVDPIPFKVEMDSTGTTKSILTNEQGARLIYTFDQEQVSSFTLYFVKTLSYLLAHNMAMALTAKLSLQDRMLDRYLLYIANASAANANEGIEAAPREAESIRARS